MGRRLKAVTDKPVLLGIGISNAEQAVEAARFGDGVIVGQRARARGCSRAAGPRPRTSSSASCVRARRLDRCLSRS